MAVVNGAGPPSEAAVIQNIVVRRFGSTGIAIGDLRGLTRGNAIVLGSRVFHVNTGIEVLTRSRATIRNNVILFVGNVVTNNHTRLPGGFDCEDLGGRNTWTGNVGGTSRPPRICPPPGASSP